MKEKPRKTPRVPPISARREEPGKISTWKSSCLYSMRKFLSLYLSFHLSLQPSVIWNSPQGEGVVLRLKAGRLSLSDKVVLGVLARLRASSPFSYVFRLQGSNLLIQSFESSEQNIWEHYKSNHLNCSNVEHRGNSSLLHRSHLVLHPALAEMVCLTHDWKL